MIWNNVLRYNLFSALAPIKAIEYLSMDFGQADAYLNEELPHPPFRCPAILVSDIREDLESSDKELDRYRLTFTLKLIVDDARFATMDAPDAHIEAYDDSLLLSDAVTERVRALIPEIVLLARNEAQLKDSLRQFNITFTLVRRV